jgi:hypothetical protein
MFLINEILYLIFSTPSSLKSCLTLSRYRGFFFEKMQRTLCVWFHWKARGFYMPPRRLTSLKKVRTRVHHLSIIQHRFCPCCCFFFDLVYQASHRWSCSFKDTVVSMFSDHQSTRRVAEARYLCIGFSVSYRAVNYQTKRVTSSDGTL